jgi:hypothetical protein
MLVISLHLFRGYTPPVVPECPHVASAISRFVPPNQHVPEHGDPGGYRVVVYGDPVDTEVRPRPVLEPVWFSFHGSRWLSGRITY